MNLNSPIVAWLIQRAREPSTYAGGSALGMVLGQYLGPELGASMLQLLAGAAAVAAVVMKERQP